MINNKPGKIVQGKHLKGFMIMPAKPGTCPDCAVNHDPEHPHNAGSMAYQYFFYNQHGRWPDWRDAMTHCTEAIRAQWTRLLTEKGVDVAGGKVCPG